MRLPAGFTVRLRDDVRRLPGPDGGVVLVGGSPLRALRLAPAASRMIVAARLQVTSPASATVAGRLLDGNLADPVGLTPAAATDLTVVVPTRDRPEQLDRCLAALGGLATIVVDDASREPAAVAAVAGRHGATLVVLPVNRGPAAARNEGLARVETPYAAFVDSDVTATPEILRALAGHLADPRVALVGPLVQGRSRSERPRWFERYDEAASSLALGTRACSVRPGAAVGWLPSACLVGRAAALRSPEIDGFDAALRVGEDVDLVWRLVQAGHAVRYEPSLRADHDVRTTMHGWLGRKVLYGSGSAELARRHPGAVAPAILTPAMAAAGAAVLARRRWSPPVVALAVALGARSVSRALPDVPGRPALALQLATRGLGWAVRQESALLLRHWWPAALAGAAASSNLRRAVATALLVDSAIALLDRPGESSGLMSTLVGRRLDDLAYGTGLWLGALRQRSPACLRPTLVRRGGRTQARVRPVADLLRDHMARL
ncbi:mycofactocin biosynthesis glycosyltransferase MftF [Nocardioides sp.]|uniref:mycofactocin biosynthesis glycosyltransferase MftF n=1 Tax=Nocardioides sp. TaxID=35761 RepID=UPI0039E4D898